MSKHSAIPPTSAIPSPGEAGRLAPMRTAAPLSRESIEQISRRFRGLGAFVSLWDAEAQCIYHDPAAGRFWATLWKTGTLFQDVLRQTALDCTNQTENPSATSSPLWKPDLQVWAVPVRIRRRIIGAVVACVRTGNCTGEAFQRLCDQSQLDATLLSIYADELHLTAAADAEAISELLMLAVDQAREIDTLHDDTIGLATNLDSTYEELQLIYRVSAEMGLPQRPSDMLARVGHELGAVSRAASIAFVLREIHDPSPVGSSPAPDLASRVVQSGKAAPGLVELDRIAAQILAGNPNQPHVLINSAAAAPEFAWAAEWLKHVVALPLVHNQRVLGTLLAINCSDGEDFTSVDVQLFRAVADRVTAFLENQRLYDDLADLLMGMLHAMVNSIDAKDPYTCGHSERVAFLSRLIARSAGLTPVECQRVYLAGLLHDVGKIGVPDAILCKPGRLTVEEFDELKKHPEIGVRILLRIRQVRDLMPGVLYHHERMDGRGYPHGLAGSAIPRIGRIICLADCFDAMTTSRTYRAAMPLPMAVAEIRRCSGTQFDPALAELFLRQDLAAAMEEARAFSSGAISLSQIGALSLNPGEGFDALPVDPRQPSAGGRP